MTDYSNIPEKSICFNCSSFCHCGYNGVAECKYFKNAPNTEHVIYIYGDWTVMEKLNDTILDKRFLFRGTAKDCIKWAKENNKILNCI